MKKRLSELIRVTRSNLHSICSTVSSDAKHSELLLHRLNEALVALVEITRQDATIDAISLAAVPVDYIMAKASPPLNVHGGRTPDLNSIPWVAPKNDEVVEVRVRSAVDVKPPRQVATVEEMRAAVDASANERFNDWACDVCKKVSIVKAGEGLPKGWITYTEDDQFGGPSGQELLMCTHCQEQEHTTFDDDQEEPS